MSNRVSLVLMYLPAASQPVPLCRIDDPNLITQAARSAVTRAEQRATVLLGVDGILGQMETIEAQRLTETLGLLVPEVRRRGRK